MFNVYTTAHYQDGIHEDCSIDVFETCLEALDSLPAGSVQIARDEWTYWAQPGDGDGERVLISYTFVIRED